MKSASTGPVAIELPQPLTALELACAALIGTAPECFPRFGCLHITAFVIFLCRRLIPVCYALPMACIM